MKIRDFLKKTLAVALVFAMLAPIMGNLEVNLKEVKAEESVDTTWYIDETEGRVYELSTPAQLKGFMALAKEHNFTKQTIKLMANISLNDVKISELTDYSGLYKWTPIGKTKQFQGTFDGNNKTISGIYCSESTRYAGLFANIGNAIIKNLTIDNSRFESTMTSGNANLSAVTGVNQVATFTNVHVTSDVVVKAGGAQWVGGISAMTNGDTTMEDCVCEAKIISGGAEVGGLIGITLAGTTTITRCKSASAITKSAGNGTGGLIGKMNAGKVDIIQCMNAGSITITGGAQTGGLIGVVQGGTLTLTDCMNAGAMNCTGDSVIGGIVGRSNTKFNMTRVFNVGSITNTKSMTGAMVGYINAATNPTTCVDCYYAETGVGPVGTASLNLELNENAECTVLTADDLAVITGTTEGKMGEFFADGVNAWTHVEGSTPVLTWTIPLPEDDSLNIKCQVTQGVVTNTSIDKYRGNYVIRFVSAVKDYTDYSEIGFKVLEENQTQEKTAVVKTVFKRIESTTGSTDTERETYTFSPKVINTDAEYFMTAKLPVSPDNDDVKYTVWAYGIKKDGTTVKGSERCVSVTDGLVESETINMSFKNTHYFNLPIGTALKANGSEAEVIGVSKDNSIVHVRISKPESLSSATLFELKTENGQTIGKEIFRNLYTKYTGSADDTWYTEYLKEDSTETKFTIATSADLYGLAELVNTDHVNFSLKTVYLVSDIDVNEENLVTDSTDVTNYKKWCKVDATTGSKSYSAAPTYSWTPIGHRNGSTYYSFAGAFDGQMHAISGIYCDMTKVTAFTDTRYGGFFGPITNANTTIKNFKLMNSYFTSNNSDFGSITGYGAGTYEKIYSNAIVEAYRERLGGLIGSVFVTNFRMDQCWFDGTVKNTNVNTFDRRGTGGLIGKTFTGVTTITNCLNTGTVDASSYVAQASTTNTNVVPMVAGFIGEVGSGTTANISYSLNAGDIKINAAATTGYGQIIGYRYGTLNMSKENVYSIRGDWTKEVLDRSAEIAKITRKEAAGLKGQSLANLDFDTIWTTVPNHIPVLQSLKTTVIDDSWYDKDADTFVLYDKADLYGFAALSQTYNFLGKTVKLGNDIEVNTGDYTTWSATNAPKDEWTPIGSKDLPFAGTFDGGLHTISGLYLDATYDNSGLFAATSGVSTVKDLKLENSYFTSTAANLGSIAGQGRGLFDTIYSDAIVTGSGQRVGGLVGMGYGTDVVMQYCWFDGTVTNTGNRETSEDADCRGTGGIIGVLYDGGSAIVRNCLNSGDVDVTEYTYNQNYKDTTKNPNVAPFAGGIVGYVKQPTGYTTTITLDRCLNLGDVLVSGDATGCYGMVVGYKEGTVIRSNLYSTTPENWTDSYPKYYTAVTEEQITGDTAKVTLANFDFTNTWSIDATTGMPILNISEANESSDVSILHQKIALNASMNATTIKEVDFEVLEDTDVQLSQGGCTDGQYYYQAFITCKDTTNAEVNNQVRILKYDLTNKTSEWSDVLLLNHANDMTYNSKLDRLIVCHNNGAPNKITFVDPETLTITGSKTLSVDIYSIAYNATKDCYVAGLSLRAGFVILNAQFEEISRFEHDNETRPVLNEATNTYTGNIGQGIGCDDNYIYCVLYKSQSHNSQSYDSNMIGVYDWSGKYVSKITLD